VAAGAPWYQDGPGGRVLLAGQWRYQADPNDQGLAANWAAQTDTAGWSPVAVPNAWNATDNSDASMAGAVGWYRRDFHVPSAPAGAGWLARFESVNYRATVFLNGKPIGQHEGASIPFEVTLAHLQPGVNHLVIRVDSRRGPTDLPPGPRGGWWNYGGILREVYLRPVTQLDISELLTRTDGPDALLVRVTLSNPGEHLRRGTVTAKGAAGIRARLRRPHPRDLEARHDPRREALAAAQAGALRGPRKRRDQGQGGRPLCGPHRAAKPGDQP